MPYLSPLQLYLYKAYIWWSWLYFTNSNCTVSLCLWLALGALMAWFGKIKLRTARDPGCLWAHHR